MLRERQEECQVSLGGVFRLLALVLMVGALVGVPYFYFAGKPEIKAEKTQASVPGKESFSMNVDKNMGYIAATNAVCVRLARPETAKFQPFIEAVSRALGDGAFFYHGYVDSQNSAGAFVRLSWKATMQKTPDGWNVVALEM